MSGTPMTINGHVRWTLRRLNYELYLAQHGLLGGIDGRSALGALWAMGELAVLWVFYWLLWLPLVLLWALTLPVELVERLLRRKR